MVLPARPPQPGGSPRTCQRSDSRDSVHRSLPVYEIYKVGEELHWIEGLDLFNFYGLKLVFIPHWNNNEGGAELDTSRCFMGQERFMRLIEMLPDEVTIVGLDEKTALIIDPTIV